MKYILLGNYDDNGQYTTPGVVSTNVISTSDLLTLQNDANSLLPERHMVTDKEWLKDNVFNCIEDGVTGHVSFIAEGAGYKNTIIFCVFPPSYKGPITREALENEAQTFIAFPNLSTPHVVLGQTIDFCNFISDESRYTHISGDLYKMNSAFTTSEKSITKGTRIILGLIPNAWKGDHIQFTSTPFFSKNSLNVETFKMKYVVNMLNSHTVVLQTSLPNYSIIGFEDIRRDVKGCDNDFNDAVLCLSFTPNDGIDYDGAITHVKGLSANVEIEDVNEPDDCDIGYKKVNYVHTENGIQYNVEAIAKLMIPRKGAKKRDGSNLPSPPSLGYSRVITCIDPRENEKSRTDYAYCKNIKIYKIPPGVSDLYINQQVGSAKSLFNSSFTWTEKTWIKDDNANMTERNICSVPGLHFFYELENAEGFN